MYENFYNMLLKICNKMFEKKTQKPLAAIERTNWFPWFFEWMNEPNILCKYQTRVPVLIQKKKFRSFPAFFSVKKNFSQSLKFKDSNS